MADASVGPMTELANRALSVLAENIPRDLRWQMLLLMLVLATGIWLLRRGHGAKTADGRERRAGLLAFLLPRDIYTHASARVDVLLYAFERLLRPLWVGAALLSISPGTEQMVIGALQAGLGASVQLQPNLAWMLLYSLIVLLAYDFVFYLIHLAEHRIPALWAIHKVHHSAEVLTPLTRYREHVLEGPLYAAGAALSAGFAGGIFGWLFEGGITQPMLFGVGFFAMLLGFNGAFRHYHVAFHYPHWLSRWLHSPVMHHVHHSYLPQHLDRNLAAVTSIWDRLFGTLYIPAKDEFTPWGLGPGAQDECRSFRQNLIAPFRDWWSMAGEAQRLRGIALICATVLAAAASPVAAEQADTIRQYQFEPASGRYRLALKEVPRPVAGAGEVLVRVRATSLNRRDLNILDSEFGPDDGVADGIPLSDGAGEVIAIGPGVSRFRVGDRVAGTFFQRWSGGAPTLDGLESARGGNAGGMLSEVIVSDENALVAIPAHLTYEEAATLPCAAVTAWVGLFKRGRLQPGQFVLLEGTGGVSVFGLILAAAAGAKPIITSSQDDKLERATALGAFGTVNYRKHPDWQREVRRLTAGAGVDQVLDVGGRETLGKALEALAPGGHVALIGGLSGYGSDLPTDSLMWINATASGVYVGSRQDFEAMNAFISEHKLRPPIDQVFEFERAPEAFDAMRDGRFMGKIVIRL